MVSSTAVSQPSASGYTASHDRSHHHGLSWSGIIGGAFAAAALALILLSLGFGLGLSSISPWTDRGVSSTKLAAGAILWLILSQVVASGLGGYLAGRVRGTWSRVHASEVYFRDTAQGFLAWSVGIVMTATFLASAGSLLVGAAAPVAAGVAATGAAAVAAGAGSEAVAASGPKSGAGATADASPSDGNGYYIDSLFRSDKSAEPGDGAVHAETARIFIHSLHQGQLAEPDRSYLASVVAARTGVQQQDADKRVGEAFAQVKDAADKAEAEARQAADAARKAAAHTALWLFVALLSGAFSASFFATIGGRHRDHLYPMLPA